MGWENVNRECIHPGLINAGMAVTFGRVGVGSRWRCDHCDASWEVVRDDDGIRKLVRR